jgi:3-dehydroquinate synthase
MNNIMLSPLTANFFAQFADRQIAVLVDDNTLQHCYPLLQPFLPKHKIICIAAGEAHKNIDTCLLIWQQLTDFQFDRKSLLINLGGGVIGDMGGFCAATYKRGIDFIQIPTTLLAQVDASVGGKLGIDFQGLKNHIGLFALPLAVCIDTNFLKTLSIRELRSGFAEILKHCLIADAQMWQVLVAKIVENTKPFFGEGKLHSSPPLSYFEELQKLQVFDWQQLVEHSVAIKSQIAEADPKEKGLRKTLNFGHTIGHAIESYFLQTPTPLLHGEAVAWGMVAEAKFSVNLQSLSQEKFEEIEKIIGLLYEKPRIALENGQEIIALALQDKKNSQNKILSCALQNIGNCVYDKEISPAIFEKLLEMIFIEKK